MSTGPANAVAGRISTASATKNIRLISPMLNAHHFLSNADFEREGDLFI
jgi:hypothetical protein